MTPAKETTPYAEAVSIPEDQVRYNGLPCQWDEDHSFAYLIPNELAKSKYQHLIDIAILSEWDEEEYMEGIEEYEDDPEEYKYQLAQIP